MAVPARNERRNIAAMLDRLPALTGELEVIFVEGHSIGGTWDEIDRVAGGRPEPLALRRRVTHRQGAPGRPGTGSRTRGGERA